MGSAACAQQGILRLVATETGLSDRPIETDFSGENDRFQWWERKQVAWRDKRRARRRVVESRQVGVCWPGPSGAIDPGWPYIRDRKPELHASSPSPWNPPSLRPSLSLSTPPPPLSLSLRPVILDYKLLSIHHSVAETSRTSR